MQETWVQSLRWEDPLEKGKATTPVFWPREFQGVAKSWTWLSHFHFSQFCCKSKLLLKKIKSLLIIKNKMTSKYFWSIIWLMRNLLSVLLLAFYGHLPFLFDSSEDGLSCLMFWNFLWMYICLDFIHSTLLLMYYFCLMIFFFLPVLEILSHYLFDSFFTISIIFSSGTFLEVYWSLST